MTPRTHDPHLVRDLPPSVETPDLPGAGGPRSEQAEGPDETPPAPARGEPRPDRDEASEPKP